jgi:hypothetical protein
MAKDDVPTYLAYDVLRERKLLQSFYQRKVGEAPSVGYED